MIVLLGASGYVGSIFASALKARSLEFLPVSRRDLNYYDRETLTTFLRHKEADFLINAAGYTGKPNVDACELHKTDCMLGNAVLPGVIKEACESVGISWGHVSSGCIYSGRAENGDGFTEEDTPNFSFRSNHCSFYSGCKALGEEVLADAERCYIWRLRIPFNNLANPRNYLMKLIRYQRLLDAENSISHLDEFVKAALECYLGQVPYGIYNMTNPGAITTRQVVGWIEEVREQRKRDGRPQPFPESFDFFESEEEFMQLAANTPRSNCVMNTDKLAKTGIVMRPVEEAVREALANWKPQNQV